jgi:hypothetical protein
VAEWTTSLRAALSSTPNMTIKAVENRLDRSVEGYADSARPVRQMLSRSEMSTSGKPRVPVLTQLVTEARHERRGRSNSKIADPPGRLEVLGEHDVLLSWGRHDNAESSEGDPAQDAQSSGRDPHQLRITIGSALNRGPDEWLATFADPVRAQSAIDRFTSNAYDLVIEGESYRPRLKPRPLSARKRSERTLHRLAASDVSARAFSCRFSAGRDPGFSKPFPPDLSSRLSARAAR